MRQVSKLRQSRQLFFIWEFDSSLWHTIEKLNCLTFTCSVPSWLGCSLFHFHSLSHFHSHLRIAESQVRCWNLYAVPRKRYCLFRHLPTKHMSPLRLEQMMGKKDSGSCSIIVQKVRIQIRRSWEIIETVSVVRLCGLCGSLSHRFRWLQAYVKYIEAP